MKHEEADRLERQFCVKFPAGYREAVTDPELLLEASEELVTEPEDLRVSNEGCRREAPWGFPWKTHYWWIGEDGAGGFYFINTHEDDSTVYYCDHEDMPDSILDTDRLKIKSLAAFIEIRRSDIECNEREQQMRKRTSNRKWWQFWIP